MIYQHKQTGYFIIVIFLIFLAVGFVPLFMMENIQFASYIIIGIAFLLLLLFYRLNIQVFSDKIVLKYGVGIIKITKKVDKINATHIIRTPWYWGLGIRFTPDGWLYNIHSLNAVKLDYTEDGKLRKITLGHPHPLELKNVIEKMKS